METVLYKEILEEFGERLERGFNIDSRLLKSVLKANKSPVSKLVFDTKEEFLLLQFHDNSASRLLTPPGRSRTLADCVEQMVKFGWTFEKLWQGLGLSNDIHNPDWFRPCLKIYDQFSYNNFILYSSI